MSIIRGGQITLHNVRMMKQVFAKTLLIFIFLALSCATYILHKIPIITFYNLKSYFIYYYSSFLMKFGLDDRLVQIINMEKVKVSYAVKDIIYNDNLVRLVNSINFHAKSSLEIGLEIATICTLLLITSFYIRGKILRKDTHISGAKLSSPFSNKTRSYIHNYKNFHFTPLKIASIPFPYKSSSTHTLITGASGSGKTVLISDIINQLKNKKAKVIIYDKMGVYTKRFFNQDKGDILLNPLDIRSSSFNLISEINKKNDCDNIAKAFISSKGSSEDPFWENAAKIVFAEILKYLKEQNINDNKSLKDIFFGKDATLFNKIIKSSVACQKILPDNSERTTGSILTVMLTYIASLRYLKEEEENIFSIGDWIKDDSKSGFLIISSRADQHESLKPLISVYIETAINNILSLNQSQNREIYLILDELPTLQYVPSLMSGLAESRQFGSNFFLSIQDISQIRDIYHKNKSQSINALCRNKIIFSTDDQETAKYYSDNIGIKEIEETRESFSYGSSEIRDGVNLNKHSKKIPIVSDSEIMNLEDLNFYLKFKENNYITKTKISYKEFKEITESFVEDEKISRIIAKQIKLDDQNSSKQLQMLKDVYSAINKEKKIKNTFDEEILIDEEDLESQGDNQSSNTNLNPFFFDEHKD